MKWRPISTAPRDGELIMLAEYMPGNDVWNVMMGRWVEAFREWPQHGAGLVKLDESLLTVGWVVVYPATYPPSGYSPATWFPKTLVFRPTHWQPRPKPPVKAATLTPRDTPMYPAPRR